MFKLSTVNTELLSNVQLNLIDRIFVCLQLDSGETKIGVPRIMLELFPKEAYTGGKWNSS
jgi:hypothetical protein